MNRSIANPAQTDNRVVHSMNVSYDVNDFRSARTKEANVAAAEDTVPQSVVQQYHLDGGACTTDDSNDPSNAGAVEEATGTDVEHGAGDGADDGPVEPEVAGELASCRGAT